MPPTTSPTIRRTLMWLALGLIAAASLAAPIWAWTMLSTTAQILIAMGCLALVALWCVADDLEPQPRLPSTCPHCGARGRATLAGDVSLLWSCPRCGAMWTSREEEW